MGSEKKFTLRFILDLYDAFLRESDLNKVAEALDVEDSHLCVWLKQNKHLKLAKELADERRQKTNSLANYILGNLSPKALKIWKEIEFWTGSEETRGTPKQMQKVSTNIRKEIFLQALVTCSYNISRACRIAGINRQTMDTWNSDPEFFELLQEVHRHKKDYFENALMDLVELRYPGAVMFVNRTINADRGYNERMDVNHHHTIGSGIDISQLDLDIETRKKILEAIRKKKQATNGHSGEIVDVEEVKQLPENTEAKE